MSKPFLLVLLAIGLMWLRSSLGKITEGKFVDSLGATLTKFAGNNPYPFYKSFLEDIAIPNSKTFGLLTMWGEFFAAIAITISVVYLLSAKKSKLPVKTLLISGLVVGIFLNTVFWLASGWTSASTDSLNLLMIAVQSIALVFLIKAKA